jgi:hypothetical protein
MKKTRIRIGARAGALLFTLCLSGCGGAFARPPACSAQGNPDISDPGSFYLYLEGPGLSAVVDNLDHSAGGLTQTNTCSGIASVDFVYHPSSSEANVVVAPVAVGTCSITFFDSHECLTDGITVHPGMGIPMAARRSSTSRRNRGRQRVRAV